MKNVLPKFFINFTDLCLRTFFRATEKEGQIYLTAAQMGNFNLLRSRIQLKKVDPNYRNNQ